MKNFKIGIISVAWIVLFIGLYNAHAAVIAPEVKKEVYTELGERKLPEPSKYVPGELVVKLKPGSSLHEIAELNARFGVTGMDKVFPSAVSPEEELRQLKNKLAQLAVGHQRWYWQLDKNSSEYKDYAKKLNQDKKKLNEKIALLEAVITKDNPVHLETTYLLKTNAGANIPDMARVYSAYPAVEYAEPNLILHAMSTGPDPYLSSSNSWGQGYADLWGLKKIQAESAWATSEGEGVIVAVIDTGVDYAHEDFTEDTNGNGILDAGEDLNSNGVLDCNIWINAGEFPRSVDTNGDGEISIDELKPHLTDIYRNGKIDLRDLINGFYTGSKFFDKVDNDGNGYVDDFIGYKFSTSSAIPSDPMDDAGHGAHVAGTIAAVRNNGIGIAGVAPKAKIMAIKGLNGEGAGAESDLAAGIEYAIVNGAKVISCSWGGIGHSSLLEDAFLHASEHNIVCVVAAGNSSLYTKWFTPANIPTVIVVSASNQNDEFCNFSNLGDDVAVAAPGGDSITPATIPNQLYNNILSLHKYNTDMSGLGLSFVPKAEGLLSRYYRSAGTSMACPHVAGVAALLLAHTPDMSPETVDFALKLSADKTTPGRDIYLGYGRVNAAKALQYKDAKIEFTAPLDGSYIGGAVTLGGKAKVTGGKYEIYYAPSGEPTRISSIVSLRAADKDGVLGSWNTTSVQDGDYLLTFRVVSAGGKAVNKTKLVKIDNVNSPPRFVSVDKTGYPVGKEFSWEVQATDPDDPRGPFAPRLTYSVSGMPSDFTFNSSTHILASKGPLTRKGRFPMQFMVSDGTHTVTQNFVFTTVYVEETVVYTGGNTNGFLPQIYDNRAVWRDQTVEAGKPRGHLYLYDTFTKVTTLISNNSDPQAISWPDIYGDKIVWLDVRDYRATLYQFNLATGIETPVPIWESIGLLSERVPKIYQDKVVFAGLISRDNMIPAIYLYDLADSNPRTCLKQITDHTLPEDYPQIFGNHVVWFGWREMPTDITNSGRAIYDYNISTGERKEIAHSTLFGDVFPAVHKDKIVWSDGRKEDLITITENRVVITDDKRDIYLFDLTEQKEHRITNDAARNIPIELLMSNIKGFIPRFSEPDIYEDKIIWNDGRLEGSHIFLHDLATGTEYQITTGNTETYSPKISKNNIAWVRFDKTPGHWGWIMMTAKVYFLPQLETVALSSASEVTLTGKNFGYQKEESFQVQLNGVSLSVKSWSDNQIVCTLPAGASSGDVKVVTLGGESAGVPLIIDGSSHAPYFDPLPTDQNVKEGDALSFTISAKDSHGDTLTYFVAGVPPRGASFDPDSHTFAWRPDYRQSGTYSVTFRVSDGTSTTSATITITVIDWLHQLTVIRGSGSGIFVHNSSLAIKANPAESGYIFDKWTGGITGVRDVNRADTSITLTGDATVTATYKLSTTTYSLTISAEHGTVTKKVDGRVTTESNFTAGTVVELTASDNAGYKFTNWFGDLSGSANPAAIVMNGNKVVGARFSAETYSLTLTVLPAGKGTITKNPDKAVYNYGEVVTLTAAPVSGYRFDAWSGDLTGRVNPVTLTMNGNKTMNANFAVEGQVTTHTLTISAVGGTVSRLPIGVPIASPNGLNNVINRFSYTQGAQVTLTASAASGYKFLGWRVSNLSSSLQNPIVLTMDQDKYVMAVFGLDTTQKK